MEPVPSKAILSAQNVSKGFGGQPVLQGISVTIHEGDRIGLMGRNGAGKSTLLQILSEVEHPDDGEVVRALGLRVALLNQQCDLDPQKTVGTVLREAGSEIRALLHEYHEVTHGLAETPLDSPEHARLQVRCERLHHTLEIADAWNLEPQIKRVATSLNVPDDDRLIGTLSGGELRRVDIAATLIHRPDVILLDEPTNQIDTQSVEWLETFIKGYPGSCVLVTHDRYFLDRVVNRIIELEFGRIWSFPGNYTRFLEYKALIVEQQDRTEANRLGFLRRELDWVKRGPKARTSKDKHRLERYYEVEAQGPPKTHKDFGFEIPVPNPLGKRIIEVDQIARAYGEKVLFRRFTMILQKGMRVGIVGPNGCGKTTLLKVLMGAQEPDEGKVFVGENTEFLYVDQTREEVNPAKTILEHVSDGQVYWEIGNRRIYVPAFLEKFLFDKNSCHMPMSNLSGGETNRIVLVKKLLRGGNVLVLDEPTNDLDLYTMRILEEAVLGFNGCVLIVSHDRYFLNRVCTHLISFEGDGELVLIAGNYDDYLAYREKKAAAEAAATPPKVPVPKLVAERPRPASDRLTWKEKKELEGMHDAIETAESLVLDLEARTASPDFYRSSSDEIRKTLADLEEARRQADTLYSRWEELDSRNR